MAAKTAVSKQQKKLASCKALARPSVHETRLLLLLLGPTRCFGLVNDRFGLWLKRLTARACRSELQILPADRPIQAAVATNNDSSTVRRTAAGVLQRLLRNRGNILACLHTPPMYTRCTDGARVAQPLPPRARSAGGTAHATRASACTGLHRLGRCAALVCSNTSNHARTAP